MLEVGCNDGSNLIPMAVSLPAARFVGCDLSPRALDAGRRTIDALGLANITLVEGDLAALAPAHGEFDFIVAHGVYSWVPPEVRDALFALAAQRLAPDGILYASFNVLPGWRVRGDSVTTLLHTQVGIADMNALRLLPLVDGTRDRAALAAAVKQIAIDIEPSRAQDFVNYAAREVRAAGAADGRRPASSANAQ